MIDTSAGELLSNEELLAQYIRGLQPKNILKTYGVAQDAMKSYLEWLKKNGYDLGNLQVP